jgi:toxin CcdB
MAQFDVYRFKPPSGKSIHVVDLQSELLDSLATRIVAPLYPIDATAQPIRRLNPAVTLKGKYFYLATQELTALRRKSLGKSVASLSHMRSELIAALDLLLTGV